MSVMQQKRKAFFVIFRFGLWLKMRFIAISMVSWSGILVKIQEIRNLWERSASLIWETKEKISLQE